jgi:light-regulated signal transduction histidine kinase (bacteriophytochrome)
MMEAYPGIDQAPFFATLRRCMEQRVPARLENEFVYPDGSTGWFDLSMQPVSEGVFILSQDITERKRAEEAVRLHAAELERRVAERTADLEAANRELEAFSYSVSHDLRAPLRAADGFSRILQEDYAAGLDEKAHRYLDLVRDSTQRMGRLIDDLLAFSRLGRQEIVRRRVRPEAIARQALDELDSERAGRAVEIQIDDMAEVTADPGLLRQVYVNLLSNALKFTRARTPAIIRVGSCPVDGGRAYFVHDNGAGFDMTYADKLFGVFQRLHRQEEYEGTGVGLAIVQRVVHRHGGRVWAEGAVDEGATFYFTLPEENGS